VLRIEQLKPPFSEGGFTFLVTDTSLFFSNVFKVINTFTSLLNFQIFV